MDFGALADTLPATKPPRGLDPGLAAMRARMQDTPEDEANYAALDAATPRTQADLDAAIASTRQTAAQQPAPMPMRMDFGALADTVGAPAPSKDDVPTIEIHGQSGPVVVRGMNSKEDDVAPSPPSGPRALKLSDVLDPRTFVEPALQAVTGMAAQVPAGIAGLGAAALPGDEGAGAAMVNRVRDELTYKPQSAGAQAVTHDLGAIGQRVGDAVKQPINVGGTDINPMNIADNVASAGHPGAATALRVIPDAASMLLSPEVRGALGMGGEAASAAGTTARVEPSLYPKPTEPPRPPTPTTPPAAPGYVPPPAPLAAAPKFGPVDNPNAPDGLTAAQRKVRADTLQQLGLDPTQHAAAVTGDVPRGGVEYTRSKVLDDPVGQQHAAIIDNEQAALRAQAAKLVEQAGGTPDILPDTRGQAIVKPLNELSDYFDNAIRSAYTDARAVAGDQPNVATTRLREKIADPDFRDGFTSSSDGESFLKTLDGKMTRVGADDLTVNQAENLRQWLNERASDSPRFRRQIGQIKQALDYDVATVGGEDTFKFARDLHGIRKDTLDNPKGIASILEESGPDGINRQVPFERIPNRIVEMPNAQFQHIVQTLQNVPEEIQPAAQQALREIRSQLAERVVAKGTSNAKSDAFWNAQGFSDAANSLPVRGKLPMVFSPEELGEYQLLDRGGHFLARDTKYKGAAVQEANLFTRGAATLIPKAGTVAGGAIGTVFGAPVTGAVAGQAAGNAVANRVLQGAAMKRADAVRKGVPLSDLINKQP